MVALRAMIEMPRTLRGAALGWRLAEGAALVMAYGGGLGVTLLLLGRQGVWRDGLHLTPGAATVLAGLGVILLIAGAHQLAGWLVIPALRARTMRSALVQVERLVARQALRHELFHSWIDARPGAVAVGKDELMLCDASTGYVVLPLASVALIRVQYLAGRDRLRVRLLYRRPRDGRSVATTIAFRHMASAERFLGAIRRLVDPARGGGGR
ncbi:hypothetical protein [Sphingomonas parapaucimobilis]|uniref:hypothetical protein n=2 Tax=Sphingomonas parapaucimobilis TaxID=28213 RepID=UPI00321977D8